MTPKPRAGGKVKAGSSKGWGWVSLAGDIMFVTLINSVGERPIWNPYRGLIEGRWVEVEIRELPAVKSRGRKSK